MHDRIVEAGRGLPLSSKLHDRGYVRRAVSRFTEPRRIGLPVGRSEVARACALRETHKSLWREPGARGVCPRERPAAHTMVCAGVLCGRREGDGDELARHNRSKAIARPAASGSRCGSGRSCGASEIGAPSPRRLLAIGDVPRRTPITRIGPDYSRSSSRSRGRSARADRRSRRHCCQAGSEGCAGAGDPGGDRAALQ